MRGSHHHHHHGSARTSITRREYDEWVREAAALGKALRYPITEKMVNDSAGIVFGADQYDAFKNGMWSGEPYEAMIIFESLNEPAVDGLPTGAAPYAEYSGLCDKLMIVHPGKFCPPHHHGRKTESYEVVLGEMEVFYSPTPSAESGVELLNFSGMPVGSPWPEGVALPKGRESSYEKLTSYVRLRAGDPKFVMHRKHLHAFRCPPDSDVPLVVRQVSTYSHEPTEAAAGNHAPIPSWLGMHDNDFVSDAANTGRLQTAIS
uniref:L-Ribose isomerase n=1 Tax=Acinetobacter sp. DL-28 TaxID=160971 RepID=UPI00045FEBF1|nr:Chain A, L-Ribose isomerase [Acinetobacter sp. DL-28]4Q0V_A Chain A, L-Ribose isomerase [Acinetobacter sp. DL-28]